MPLSLNARKAAQIERLKGGHGIVADPDFEKIAQDVQRLCRTGASGEEIQKRPGDVRALLFQMQI